MPAANSTKLVVVSPAAPVPFGSSVKLSGLARGVSGVALEERTPAASWHSAGPVAAAANGALQLIEKPTITTDYRLATATARRRTCVSA